MIFINYHWIWMLQYLSTQNNLLKWTLYLYLWIFEMCHYSDHYFFYQFQCLFQELCLILASHHILKYHILIMCYCDIFLKLNNIWFFLLKLYNNIYNPCLIFLTLFFYCEFTFIIVIIVYITNNYLIFLETLFSSLGITKTFIYKFSSAVVFYPTTSLTIPET